FLAQGKEVGKSLVERDKVDLARALLQKAASKIKLPVDTVISDQLSDDAQKTVVCGKIPADMGGVRIGPELCGLYTQEVGSGMTGTPRRLICWTECPRSRDALISGIRHSRHDASRTS